VTSILITNKPVDSELVNISTRIILEPIEKRDAMKLLEICNKNLTKKKKRKLIALAGGMPEVLVELANAPDAVVEDYRQRMGVASSGRRSSTSTSFPATPAKGESGGMRYNNSKRCAQRASEQSERRGGAAAIVRYRWWRAGGALPLVAQPTLPLAQRRCCCHRSVPLVAPCRWWPSLPCRSLRGGAAAIVRYRWWRLAAGGPAFLRFAHKPLTLSFARTAPCWSTWTPG
jgi:hypothetical protein